MLISFWTYKTLQDLAPAFPKSHPIPLFPLLILLYPHQSPFIPQPPRVFEPAFYLPEVFSSQFSAWLTLKVSCYLLKPSLMSQSKVFDLITLSFIIILISVVELNLYICLLVYCLSSQLKFKLPEDSGLFCLAHPYFFSTSLDLVHNRHSKNVFFLKKINERLLKTRKNHMFKPNFSWKLIHIVLKPMTDHTRWFLN